MLKTIVLLKHFLENVIHFQDSLRNRNKTADFTVIFIHCNVSLVNNNNIISLKKLKSSVTCAK